DAGDWRRKGKDCSQAWLACQRINIRRFQTKYEQMTTGGRKRRFCSCNRAFCRRLRHLKVMLGSLEIFSCGDGFLIKHSGAVVSGLGELDLGHRRATSILVIRE